MKSCKGFTLLEILIALFVSSVVMLSLTMYCLSQQESTLASTNVSDMQQSLRAAMDLISREIRMAGYDPSNSGGFGFLDIGFRDYAGVEDLAGEDFLQIAWDANGDGVRDNAEIISYSLSDDSEVSPDSIALTRQLGNVLGGGAGRQPVAGYIVNMGFAFAIDEDQDGKPDRDPADDDNIMWVVDSDGNGTWDNLDTNGDGIISELDNGGKVGVISGTATGIPVSAKHIRAVRVWLLARSEAPDPKYVDRHIYVVGRHVVQPNDRFRHRLLERTVFCRNAGLNL